MGRSIEDSWSVGALIWITKTDRRGALSHGQERRASTDQRFVIESDARFVPARLAGLGRSSSAGLDESLSADMRAMAFVW